MDFTIILIAIAFFTVIIAKPLFDRLNIPISLSAMFVGMLLGLFPTWERVANDSSFSWFANLGMLFMIFVIIFQIKSPGGKKSNHLGSHLVKSGLIIVGLELMILFPVVYFFMEKNFLGALLVSLVFTTVAEAMVIPVLHKFKIVNTKLGNFIVGIGIFDNLFETIVIVIASFNSLSGHISIKSFLLIFIFVTIMFIMIRYFSKSMYINRIVEKLDVSELFLLSIGTLFLFGGVMSLVDLDFLGAVIAALLMKGLTKDLPKLHTFKLKELLNESTKGLFEPIFFLWVGLSTSLAYITQKPILAIIFVCVGFFAKLVPSIIATRKELNLHSSFIMGIALKFGSGILFIKLLFEKAVITELTYTLVIAAILIYRLVIPFLLGYFITRWRKDIV